MYTNTIIKIEDWENIDCEQAVEKKINNAKES